MGNELTLESLNKIREAHRAVEVKTPYEGSRSVFTEDVAYTELWHDNKLMAFMPPYVFMRIVKLNEA